MALGGREKGLSLNYVPFYGMKVILLTHPSLCNTLGLISINYPYIIYEFLNNFTIIVLDVYLKHKGHYPN